MRPDTRQADHLREISILTAYQHHPPGSVLISCGQTRVICAVNVTPGVPSWMRDQQVPGGWLTAEYRMLPGSSADRVRRSSGSGPGGRTREIQRLIGRSLRSVVDLRRLGQNTVYVDCDVLDADGGTRCASITGASLALEMAFRRLYNDGELDSWPMRDHVAAVSVGIVDGEVRLDLCYEEDRRADVDMNVVATATGNLVEVQGTAEGAPFSQDQLNDMIALAREGAEKIASLQKDVLRNEQKQHHEKQTS